MKLIVGAPVARRDWILPRWFDALDKQTRRPDGLCFVHSGGIGDATWQQLRAGATRLRVPVRIDHDASTPHGRNDNDRFRTLARIRNRLLDQVADLDADLFLSLDTDILLQDPTTIARLERLVTSGDCDIAAPLAFLHPGAPAAWTPGQTVCWAYNFGFLTGDQDPHRSWQRPHPSALPWGELVRMHVPMGAWLGNRAAIDVPYDWHVSGEDLGYAHNARDAGLECIADTSLYACHVWSPEHLPALFGAEAAA